jgi:signal transduction histidine kinase
VPPSQQRQLLHPGCSSSPQCDSALYNIEYRLWDRHENRWRWFVGRAIPVKDEHGTIVKWFGTCTDIDEQKRIEEDLRRANGDLEQFAFSASHDLQEPLRAIRIYTELLTKRHTDKLDAEAQKFMGFVRDGATRMETLVRDLLSYTRITKVNADEIANAQEALEGALANLSSAVSETGAQISSDSLPSVRMHEMQTFSEPRWQRDEISQPGTDPGDSYRSRTAEQPLDVLSH